jgi:hypothetical protein
MLDTLPPELRLEIFRYDPVAQSFQLGALVAFGLFTRISFIPFAALSLVSATLPRSVDVGSGIGECCLPAFHFPF